MINLNFGLWHSGCKLSYLRYLTFKSLRHFHPDSKIQLFVGTKYKNDSHNWNVEKQDFENPDSIKKDYIPELSELGVEVHYVDWFGQYSSNVGADMFRYWFVKAFSGFYLDTDQIILKSFNTLPLDVDLIYSGYKALSCGYYFPVGVLGGSKKSEILRVVMKVLPNIISSNNYNSSGPFGFRSILESRECNKWSDKMFNAPSNYFYPIPESYRVNEMYSGSLKVTDESYALHYYLGHPLSQEFNKKYTREFATTSNDTISCLCRKMEII